MNEEFNVMYSIFFLNCFLVGTYIVFYQCTVIEFTVVVYKINLFTLFQVLQKLCFYLADLEQAVFLDGYSCYRIQYAWNVKYSLV